MKEPKIEVAENRNYEELKELVDLAMRGEYQRMDPVKQKFGTFRSQSTGNLDNGTENYGKLESRFMPTMREIKYLFEKLVGAKYEREMRPDYERQLDDDLQSKPTNIPETAITPAKRKYSVSVTPASEKMRNISDISKIKLLEFANDIDKNKTKDHQTKNFKLSFQQNANPKDNEPKVCFV